MLNIDESRCIAEREVADPIRTPLNPAGPAHVDGEFIVWVFNTTEFWQSGDPLRSLAGNGPIAVRRSDGSVFHLPTAVPLSDALAQLRDESRLD